MVVSRSDVKRKRKDSDTTVDTLPESPKRTKVHAQRKFAQGSNVSSPVITPVKELDREKVKIDVLPTATDLLPIKRPNTEDFLTFLCFRGTPILPPKLDFFNTTNTLASQNVSTETKANDATTASTNDSNENESSEQPFIAFGVRKRADPFINNKLEKKRRHAIALQALRRKYQEQRMAKIRAVTIEKMSEGIKIKSKNLVQTRSVTKQVRQAAPTVKRKIKVVTKRVKITTRTTVKRPILKQKMCLRSRGRLVTKELAAPLKKKVIKIVNPTKVLNTAKVLIPAKVGNSAKIVNPSKDPIKVPSASKAPNSSKPLNPTKLPNSTKPPNPTKTPMLTKDLNPTKVLNPTKIPPKKDSSSEFSSDDDEPLVKTIKKPAKPTAKIVRKIPSLKKSNLIRLTRSTQSSIRLETHSVRPIRLESATIQRPSRKTKEAAALYMELLGRKLVNDADVDEDNASIDSFPELPNVRRTEQRENEMKAKVKPTKVGKINTRKMSATIKEKAEKLLDKCNKSTIKTKLMKRTSVTSSLEMVQKFDEKEEAIEKETKKVLRSKVERKSSILSEKPLEKTTSIDKVKNIDSFSDSDEEPLVKLTLQKKITKSSKKPIAQFTENKIAVVKRTDVNSKPSSTIKKELKTVPNLEFSDEDEKAFRGFNKTDEAKNMKKHEAKCSHISEVPLSPSADLLCKDIGRRFGKGKVNMSTEQIEKWLKDSALAGECSKKESFEKKYEDDILKYEEKEECKSESKSSISPIVKAAPQSKAETVKITPKKKLLKNSQVQTIKTCNITPITNKIQSANERKYTFQQRRSILSKDRKDISPNNKAFSPDNESSVYAFEAEMETPINTPFRSHVRRPSSTATSRSEDEAIKLEDEERRKSHDGKFRLPAVVKSTKKQEVSLTLSADEANSASIAVQVNLDSAFGESSMECSTQTDAGEDDGHLFYIPLQPGSKSTANTHIIQGVAVKLGTEGSDGVNQRVVMRAKLVTQPDRLTIKPLSQSTNMYPPIGTVQPTYRPTSKPIGKAMPEPKCDSIISTVPSSPSASSSSSAKIYKRPVKPRARSLDMCFPTNKTEFPGVNQPAQLVEAPTFHPSEREFQDPIEFIEKIRPYAEKFGICRIIPPANFKPECKVSDDMRFTAYNQYIHKMLHRWGPNYKEFMAIKKYLATQSITFTHPPWIGGMEIDLPRLYQTVQSLGGLKEVIEKKRWPRVAEGMKIPKSAQDRVTKLDDIYCKYLLPYDTLSPAERQKLFDEVETDWAKREARSLLRSQQQNSANVSIVDSNESDSESGDEETDECTVKGRNMALNAFYRIARNTMSMWFKSPEPTAQDVEQEFWKHVTTRQNHLCVHSGSIDSSGWGYGFACSKNSPFARHPWNLKILTNNSGSVLRTMGPIMGVTVPTLHVGMVFSACCWYRDPHGLPWIEYLHTGANKIWYGIPSSLSDIFRGALRKIVPSYCRNKTLWLTSDTAMVPPSLLVQNGVSLCRTVQEPGQFIIVFPRAFTSSICSGYVVSESVYFAPPSWLQTAQQAFKDIRESCESSMFSFERLLLSISTDSRSSAEVLQRILPIILELRAREHDGRKKLDALGLKTLERLPVSDNSNARKKKKMQEDDGEYECEICRSSLYVSLVIDSEEEGVFCLDHAIEHLKLKPNQLNHCKLLFTYDTQDLDNLLEKIKLSIETKSIKRPGKVAYKVPISLLK